MESLLWLYNRVGNISRYTMGFMAPLNPRLNVWLTICDKSFGGKGYYLLDVINKVKEFQAKLVLVTIAIMRMRIKKPIPIPIPTSKRSSASGKRKRNAGFESDVRTRTSAKTRVRHAD